MYFFLITFLTLYGGIHLYTYFKLRSVYHPKPHLTWLLIILMSATTIAPLLVRLAEQFGMVKTALIIAWPCYLWMGFIFILASMLLFADTIIQISRLVFSIIARRLPVYSSPRKTITIVFALAVTTSIYSYYEAGQIRSEHVVISSPKLPASTSKIRIIQISDVHIGLLLREKRLQLILDKIKAAGPDIIVSTGDLIDGKLNRDDAISELNPLSALLSSAQAPLGKFAVIGNHEIYAGIPQAVAFTSTAGFTMIRNQSIRLTNGLTITGIDDRAVNPKALSDAGTEIKVTNSVSKKSFHLLLKHRPEILPESDGHFDLQLSGHVHGGQIFPFNLLVKLKHPIPCGMSKTAAGSLIYVSRGTGTWGPPMRLFAPPEITIIDIFSDGSSQ